MWRVSSKNNTWSTSWFEQWVQKTIRRNPKAQTIFLWFRYLNYYLNCSLMIFYLFFVKIMLTVKHLQEMQPREIFARWSFTDNSFWINFMWSGEVLKRVAVRWIWMHDRSIYVWHEFEASFTIAKQGDKLYSTESIRRLVNCTDEAFALYRR